MVRNTKKLNYNEIVLALLAYLNEREQEVVAKRHALNGEAKTTLEQIGRAHNITRERVRQIENEALKKLRGIDHTSTEIPVDELVVLVSDYLGQHGGFMGHSHLIDKLLHTKEDEREYQALNFLLEKIVSGQFQRSKFSGFDIVWRLENIDEDTVKNLGDSIKEIIESHGKPVAFDELMIKCSGHTCYPVIEKLDAENHYILESVLHARKDLNKNILSQWGRDNWTTIRPKRMTDKAYLIMLRENRPLHFEECASLINEAGFDKKKACAATVHNELILDDKYVLVGRGIYALKDWGFEEGTVTDIIARILKQSGALDKQSIMDEVLKQRIVQKTTVTLALMNKDKFAKTEDGKYALVA